MIKLKQGLTIGHNAPVRVNCNVGCNCVGDYNLEVAKLKALQACGELPDMMMDLSLMRFDVPLYTIIRDDLRLPFGTVLSYYGFSKDKGLVWDIIRDSFLKLCDDGISFVTIHFTADMNLLIQAQISRIIPITSRGGGIVLYDTELNSRRLNIFIEHIDELADIALRYNVAISLGTTFRPAAILDACDTIHIEETNRQLGVCRYLQKKGVNVIVENIGHISLDKIEEYSLLLKQFEAPIMPLGPLPTDAATNEDHIANAVGAAFAAYNGCAHIVNCVTRYEHSESEITQDVTIEAIKSARLVAHMIDVAHGIPEAIDIDRRVSEIRAKNHSCFTDNRTCTRCSDLCPLKLNIYDRNWPSV